MILAGPSSKSSCFWRCAERVLEAPQALGHADIRASLPSLPRQLTPGQRWLVPLLLYLPLLLQPAVADTSLGQDMKNLCSQVSCLTSCKVTVAIPTAQPRYAKQKMFRFNKCKTKRKFPCAAGPASRAPRRRGSRCPSASISAASRSARATSCGRRSAATPSSRCRARRAWSASVPPRYIRLWRG